MTISTTNNFKCKNHLPNSELEIYTKIKKTWDAAIIMMISSEAKLRMAYSVDNINYIS